MHRTEKTKKAAAAPAHLGKRARERGGVAGGGEGDERKRGVRNKAGRKKVELITVIPEVFLQLQDTEQRRWGWGVGDWGWQRQYEARIKPER